MELAAATQRDHGATTGEQVMDHEIRDPDYQRRVRESFARQGFMRHLGVEMAVVKPGFCELGVAYREELAQQHGFFHGGVIGTLADNAGGYAAFTLMPAEATILTVEYKLNLMAPGTGERLVARAEVIRGGRNLSVCRCDVVAVAEGAEKLCASALATYMALFGRTDTPD